MVTDPKSSLGDGSVLSEMREAFLSEFRQAREPGGELGSLPKDEDRRLLQEAAVRLVAEAPLRWEMLRLQRPLAAFAKTFVVCGVVVVLAHAVAWLVAGGGSTEHETLNTLRYTLSAIAQSLAAVLGLTFTALLIGMQFFSERYAAAASKFLLRDPVTHATAALGSWSVLSALVLLSGVGLPLGTTAPIPVLAVNIALASITLGTAVFLAFRVMGRFSHDDFLAAISQHLMRMSRATIPRVAKRERREAEINAICEEMGVERTPVTILFKHMLNVEVGTGRAADIRTRSLRDLVSAAYAVNEEATTAPISVTLKLDAGPEKVSVASWHADAPVPPEVHQLARECVVTQPLPQDLWEDDAVSFSPLVAVAESALSKRDFDLAQRALMGFQSVLRDADEALSVWPDLAPSRLRLFADALSSLQDLGIVFIDILVPGREMTYREEEVGDAIRRAMGVVAEIALRRRDYSLWDPALSVMSRHAHALLQAGQANAGEELADQLELLLSLGLWSYEPHGVRRRPASDDGVFVERAFRSALSMAIAEMRNSRPEPAAYILRQVLHGAIPGGAHTLRPGHRLAHEMVLEDCEADGQQREHASRRLAETDGTLSFQEQALRHATAAFYGVAFVARANEWDGLADFAAEWIPSLAREVNRGVVEDTRFLEQAAEETSSAGGRVTGALFTYTPEARRQRRREGVASWGGHNIAPLHLATRLALAQLHGGYFDLDLIPYSKEAADMGEGNRLGHAIEGLANFADFLEALGVTWDDRDIEALRAVYAGHAEERERRERQAIRDTPVDPAVLVEAQEWANDALRTDPVWLPGFSHRAERVPSEMAPRVETLMELPRSLVTEAPTADAAWVGRFASDGVSGRLVGYCLGVLSDTAGSAASALTTDPEETADLILRILPALTTEMGWVFIPPRLRRGMLEHPEVSIHRDEAATNDDDAVHWLGCARLVALPDHQDQRLWVVAGDPIAEYSLGPSSLAIVNECDSEATGKPVVHLQIQTPFEVGFAVDPANIIVLDLPSGEEDTDP